MFAVTWSDPGIEKVGERKARKEKEQGSQDGEDSRLSKRGSTSTRRSSSSADKSVLTKSTGDKPSSWFGSVSLKKNRLSSKSKISHASDLHIPIPEANTVTPSLPTASTFCSKSSTTTFLTDNYPESQKKFDAHLMLEPFKTSWDEAADSRTVQSKGSSFSRSTQGTAPLFHSPFQLQYGNSAAKPAGRPKPRVVKTLGSNRGILKTTETRIEVTTETGSDCARSELTAPVERVPAGPPLPDTLITLDRNLSEHMLPLTMYEPLPLARARDQTPCRLPGQVRSRKTPTSSRRNSATTLIPPPPTRGLVKFRAHDPSRWKAPEEWDIEDERALAKGFNLEEQFRAVGHPRNESLVDLASVQREIKKMRLLVPASIIFRLDEKLAAAQNPLAYRETEMERKRLMLYALGALGNPHMTETKSTRILALFETEATASYLAAIYPESSITHLSPTPLSALLFPNVRPLVSPTISNSALSLAPNYFSSVYCLPLPAIMSSQEIPALLRNIHTCLLPGGMLHLVLINPCPASKSFGPHLRQWMEDNLLLNLEQQSRCTNPRKLIPVWLQHAGLRANDSTKTTVKCQAVFQKEDKATKERKEKKRDKPRKDVDDEQDILDLLYGGQEAAKREQQTKLELQSRVGRLLWQETWGSFVNADRWWWDDPECVVECLDLGTYWEYSIIEAVKDR